MKKVELDKISSVTKNLNLGYHEEVTRRVSTEMGTVLAAQILQDKSVYNELELPSGRLSKLKKDDIIAVALGGRAGLKGFAGHLPKSLKADDVIHLLNGVIRTFARCPAALRACARPRTFRKSANRSASAFSAASRAKASC